MSVEPFGIAAVSIGRKPTEEDFLLDRGPGAGGSDNSFPTTVFPPKLAFLNKMGKSEAEYEILLLVKLPVLVNGGLRDCLVNMSARLSAKDSRGRF